MTDTVHPSILCVDDDNDILIILKQFLEEQGYAAHTLTDPAEALVRLADIKPDLILLDIIMPVMNGYEFCVRLQQEKRFSSVPVIFLTAKDASDSKSKAFSLGAAGYLVKPFAKEGLIAIIEKNIRQIPGWKKLEADLARPPQQPPNLAKIRDELLSKLNLPAKTVDKVQINSPADFFTLSLKFGISERALAEEIAQLTGLESLPLIDPESVVIDLLPLQFCKKNQVVPIVHSSGELALVMSNPFNVELLDMVKKIFRTNFDMRAFIAPPSHILALLDRNPSVMAKMAVQGKGAGQNGTGIQSLSLAEDHPAVYAAGMILESAIAARASDIHIEPKKRNTLVRFRVDGDLIDFFPLKKETGNMVISRLKILADLDIAERRKPQDGAFEAVIDRRELKFRLATTSTSYGESLIIRILESETRPRSLKELGMNDGQEAILEEMVLRNQGCILVVGSTGSGKTTTIYTLLNYIDSVARSVISVEDPIEYMIPYANQQQVNEKAGVTFHALLRSSVRQDPDILFIGEIRDNETANVALDFSSTGHLTMASLHTTDTISSINRFERLGVSRQSVAESVVCIIAQRLLKVLCPHCRKKKEPTPEEAKILDSVTNQKFSLLGHPVGCFRCNHSGYFGREGVFEILHIDNELAEYIRADHPVGEIREFCEGRGMVFLKDHLLDKVRSCRISLQEAYDKVFVDVAGAAPKTGPGRSVEDDGKGVKKRVLIIDQDPDLSALLNQFLSSNGYDVICLNDPEKVWAALSAKSPDLVLMASDLPGLSGMEFLIRAKNDNQSVPIILMSASEDLAEEGRALAAGARDFIKKPFTKDVVLWRVKKAVSD